jgi:hypothetical protein
LLDHHLDNRRFDRPGDAVLQDRHTSRPAEALVHAKRRSTAIGKVFRLIDFTNLDQSPQRRDAIGSGSKGKQMTEHARFHDAEGIAALGICESLLLALTDLKIISEKDARDLLTDVATTHHEAATASQTPQKHQAVVEIVQRILAGKNGTRQ